MALNKRKVLEAARKHAQKGAKAKALKEYNKLLKEDPRDAKLLLEVGDAYRRWGQNEEAIAQYGKVAQQYRQDGFDARAVAVFKQILNLDPKNYGAYVSLSELYQRMGLDSEAISALQTAADGYHKEGRKSEALELLRQMAALDPTNTTSRLKVAELLRQEGMETEALSEYQAVVAELENQQDRDQLVTVLERIIELKPDQLDALTSLVRNLMAAGELERAEPMAVRALDASSEPDQHELLMDLYAQMGNEPKLADTTRGLAKLYRERGDDEKARELMQRLPVEEVGSSSRLAVDVSEVDEPDLGDEELLGDEEPFLTLGGDEDSLGDLGAGSDDLGLDLGAVADEEPSIDLELTSEAPLADDSEPVAATPPAPEVLPEGDPDQLLAEASVYLRYGKRDQAIASLRGVIAQEPAHRAALEKLGEAYADDGQNSEAVQAWMKATELVRAVGDAEGLSVLKDRIAALDPAMAEQIGPVAAAAPEVASSDENSDELSAPVMELDLDVEVDLGLDTAIDEVASSETQSGLDFGSEGDDFEIELDEDSVTFDEPPVKAAEAATPAIEETTPDFGSDEDSGIAADLDMDEEFEFEIDSDETSTSEVTSDATTDTTETVPADDDEIEFELDPNELTGGAPQSSGSQGTATAAKIDEELEEAEFYIAQEMYDEAESTIQRILDIVPNHPGALLRMGEVAAARGGAAAVEAPAEESPAAAKSANDFEVTARIDDEDKSDPDGVAFEIDVDVDDEEDEVEVDLDLADTDLDEVVEDQAEIETAPVEPVEVAAAEEVVEEISEPEVEVEAEVVSEIEPVVEPPPFDAGETFDLREALADVLTDDKELSSPDQNADSGVLSTVEDGFESIFSDFKKGVTATLDEGDYDTRYDLGIAYREMGLFEDAIGEFRVCLDSDARRFDSLYLMGLCARDLSRFDDAVNHLEQALALPDLPEDRMAGVYFDLSIAQDGGGDRERACATMHRVIAIDPDFPGAAERLAALEAGGTSSPELGEPGEAFESFDELFDGDADDDSSDVIEAPPAEAFESFDDVLSEAEAALDEAAEAELVPVADPGAANEDSTSARKSGRKKISFV